MVVGTALFAQKEKTPQGHENRPQVDQSQPCDRGARFVCACPWVDGTGTKGQRVQGNNFNSM